MGCDRAIAAVWRASSCRPPPPPPPPPPPNPRCSRRLQVFAGLLLLFLGFRAFHRRAAERSDALQQLRAAKAGQGAAGGGITGGGSGLGGIGRRGGLIEINELAQAGGSAGAHLDALLGASQLAAAAGGDADGAQAGGGRDGAAAAATPGTPPSAELLLFCEQHFGLEWVRRWGAAAQQVCSATRQLAADAGAVGGGSGSGGGGTGGASSGSTVTCRTISDSHLPPKSAPHVLCDATNLRLDPSKLVRAACWQAGWLATCGHARPSTCSATHPPSAAARHAPRRRPHRPPRPHRSAVRGARRTGLRTCACRQPTTTTRWVPGRLAAPGRASGWRPSARTTSRQAGGAWPCLLDGQGCGRAQGGQGRGVLPAAAAPAACGCASCTLGTAAVLCCARPPSVALSMRRLCHPAPYTGAL